MLTNKDRADHYRLEYDPKNPRLKMTVLGYLLQSTDSPDPALADTYVEASKKMIEFIANDVEIFAAYVEAMDAEEDDVLFDIEGEEKGSGPYL